MAIYTAILHQDLRDVYDQHAPVTIVTLRERHLWEIARSIDPTVSAHIRTKIDSAACAYILLCERIFKISPNVKDANLSFAFYFFLHQESGIASKEFLDHYLPWRLTDLVLCYLSDMYVPRSCCVIL